MSYDLKQDIQATISNSSIDFSNDLNDLVIFYIDKKEIHYLKEEDKNKDLLVKGDSLSRKFCFIIQKYFEDMDMSTTYPSILFTNGNVQHFSSKYSSYDRSETGYFSNWFGLESGTEELQNEKFIYFIWTVIPEFSLENGRNSLSILLKTDNNYRFITKPVEVKVADTLTIIDMPNIPSEEEGDKFADLDQAIIDIRQSLNEKQNIFQLGYGLKLINEGNNPTLKLDTSSSSQFYIDYLKQFTELNYMNEDYKEVLEYYASVIGTNNNLLDIFKTLEDLVSTTRAAYIEKGEYPIWNSTEESEAQF